MVCGPDDVAVFDALHRRSKVTEAMLYAFDLLERDGEDLRSFALDATMPLLGARTRRSGALYLGDTVRVDGHPRHRS